MSSQPTSLAFAAASCYPMSCIGSLERKTTPNVAKSSARPILFLALLGLALAVFAIDRVSTRQQAAREMEISETLPGLRLQVYRSEKAGNTQVKRAVERIERAPKSKPTTLAELGQALGKTAAPTDLASLKSRIGSSSVTGAETSRPERGLAGQARSTSYGLEETTVGTEVLQKAGDETVQHGSDVARAIDKPVKGSTLEIDSDNGVPTVTVTISE